MHTKTLRGLALAVGLVVSLLGLQANPAAASGWGITGGTIRVQKGIIHTDFDLANPPPDGCTQQLPPATITTTFDSPTPGQVTVTFSSQGRTSAFGAQYQSSITGSGVGSYSGTSPNFTISGLSMTFTADFITYGATPTCTPGSTTVCTWSIAAVTLGGTYTGTIPPASGASVTLNSSGGGGITASNCSGAPLLNFFDSGTASVTGLTASFT